MIKICEKMNEIVNLSAKVCDEISNKNEFSLAIELVKKIENILPELFLVSENSIQPELLEILQNIADAFENKDEVLMTDTLTYGLTYKLRKWIILLEREDIGYES